MLHAVGDGGSESPGVAEAEVETLAGERVDGVGGVADEGGAGRDVGGGLAEAEREGG